VRRFAGLSFGANQLVIWFERFWLRLILMEIFFDMKIAFSPEFGDPSIPARSAPLFGVPSSRIPLPMGAFPFFPRSSLILS